MQGFAGIALRLWLCAVCAQGFVLVTFFNGLQAARHAETARLLGTMVTLLHEPAAAKAAHGIPLRNQAALRTLIDTMSGTGAGVDLYLIDPDGIIVFSSDQGSVGSIAPARWTQPPGRRTDQWTIDSPRETVVAAPIAAPQSVPLGTAVARTGGRNLVLGTFANLMLSVRISTLFLALSGLLTVCGVIIALGPLTDAVRMMTADYRQAAAAIRGRLRFPADGRRSGLDMVASLLARLERIEDQAMAADRRRDGP